MRKLELVVLAAAVGCATKTTVVDPGQTFPGPIAPTVFGGHHFQAATPPVPIAGGTLLTVVAADGTVLAFASDPDEDAVDVVALGESPHLLGKVALQAGDEPGRLVADAGGRVHVVLRRGGAIATIVATSTGASLVQRRQVCSAPRGIDYDASSDSLWVACATGELEQLAAAGGAPTFTTKLARDLRDVIVDGNTVYITRFRSAEVLAFDTKSLAQTNTTPLGVPLGVESAAADVAWRAVRRSQGGVQVLYQIASTAPIDIAQPPGVSSYGGPVDNQVQNGAGGVVTVAVASVGGTSPQTTVTLHSNPIVDVTRPSNEDFAAISIAGVIEGTGGNMLPLDTVLTVDHGESSGTPDEFVAIATQGQWLVVQRRGANPALVVLQTPAYGSITGSSYVAEVKLPTTTSHVDTGFDVFHNATAAGIACMNCHPEGGDDGHTWMFQLADGNRARRTQSLRGGIVTASAPYHWDGDMTDLQVLCDEVFTHRMGGGSISQQQTPSLAHFLNAMPRIPVSASLDQARVASGQKIFEGSGGCTSCHQNGAGTLRVNQSIGKTDVLGQSPALQVPMLLGVADRAPYMHDGCASTLMVRLTDTNCAGSAHGNVASLGDDDKQNLVEYLESL